MRANLNRLLNSGTRYGCIIADPPWSFKDKVRMTDGVARGAADQYSTMTLRELVDMGEYIDQIGKKQSHLYLWVPSALLAEGLLVMNAWNYDYKQDLVWLKQTVKGNRHFGMGRYYRHAHEVVLFGTRNKAKARINNLIDVFEAQTRGHSAKPGELHEKAMKLSPGPYLELFARRKTAGWATWGNQVRS